MTIDTDTFAEAPERGRIPDDDQPRHPVDRARIAQDALDAAAAAAKLPASSTAGPGPSGVRPRAHTAAPARAIPGKGDEGRPAGSGRSGESMRAAAASPLPDRDAAARAKTEPEHQAARPPERPRPRPAEPKK